jgi:hypothetical protein
VIQKKKSNKSSRSCPPRLPNEIFVAFISSGFNSLEKTSPADLTGAYSSGAAKINSLLTDPYQNTN